MIITRNSKSNFFIKNKNGEPYETDSGGFSGTLIDFTNEMARKRTKDIIKDMIRLGFKGWMADFGEALPFDAVLVLVKVPPPITTTTLPSGQKLTPRLFLRWESRKIFSPFTDLLT